MFQSILRAFGLNASDYEVERFGSGLINSTWKVSSAKNKYVLQKINQEVFKTPLDIVDNAIRIKQYLGKRYPAYLFVAPLPAKNRKYLAEIDGGFYRLMPFIPNSHTVDAVSQSKQALEAGRAFGRFTALLKDFKPEKLKYTLPDFHNLDLRFEQFKTARRFAPTDRINTAGNEILDIDNYQEIVNTYRDLVKNSQIPQRVVHHDTKISNILFNDADEGLCVIDLDTVMPGFYLSDTGDMLRTYLSEANEEERDLSRIKVRADFFIAVYQGYMEQMGAVLTPYEKSLFIYSGKMMILMQALRFLTDYLNGDIYYHTSYPGHNLLRAQNQLTLLHQYTRSERKFQKLIEEYEKKQPGTAK